MLNTAIGRADLIFNIKVVQSGLKSIFTMLQTSHTWVGINTTNALFLLSRLTTFAETKKKLWYWKSVSLHDDILQARTLQQRTYYFYFTNLGFESQPLNQYILPLWSREYSEIPGSSARGYSALSSPTARQSGLRSLQQGSALRFSGKASPPPSATLCVPTLLHNFWPLKIKHGKARRHHERKNPSRECQQAGG